MVHDCYAAENMLLTWGFNYQRVDQELGNGSYPNRKKNKASEYNKGFSVTNPTGSIYLHPDKAMNRDNAYHALVWGMQTGIFTYRALSKYVNSSKTDYWNARRVINGTDRAADIAAYAENIEVLLLLATN